jgi:hypothetical protein
MKTVFATEIVLNSHFVLGTTFVRESISAFDSAIASCSELPFHLMSQFGYL